MLKNQFNNLSFRWKIRYVVTIAVTVAVMMMGIVFGFYDYRVQKQSMINELSAVSGIVANRSVAAVSFMDRQRATENLTSTVILGKIIYACIMNTMQPEPILMGEIPALGYDCVRETEGRATANFVRNTLVLENAISVNNNSIGFLKLVVNTDSLTDRLKNLILTLVITALVSISLALLLTNRFQHALYDPIVNLGEVAKTVTRDRDYQIRAKKAFNDEIGSTVEAFNAMLEILQDDKHQLERLAFYDTLTNLPNRRLLMEKLARAVARSRMTGNAFGVIFIDLDNFKWVNDNLGHDMGDLLLKVISKRTLSAVRDIDTVARLGGDEFTVILLELKDQQEAELICQRILDTLKPNVQLRNHSHQAGASLGLAVGLGVNESVDSILKKADLAVYQAKAEGKNCYRLFQGQREDDV